LLRLRPDLPIVKVADGIDDNWTFLSRELPKGEEALDFFHATEHLSLALAAAYGPSTRDARHRFEELRDYLRDEEGGVERVIRALDYLQKKFPKRNDIRLCGLFPQASSSNELRGPQEAGVADWFGDRRGSLQDAGGATPQLSGMRWGRGAQAILTARGWDQSERFDDAWAMLAAAHQVEVHALARVIPLEPPKPPRTKRSPRAKSAG